MKDFVEVSLLRINQEFAKSLPSAGNSKEKDSENEEDTDLEALLLEDKRTEFHEQPTECFTIQEPTQVAVVSPKVFKQSEKLAEKVPSKKKQVIKIEKVTEAKAILDAEKVPKDYMSVDPSVMYTEEEQLEDDGNMFGEEIYDIMEIDNESTDNIYLDETGKQVLGGDEEGEFILVNFKSSNEDLTEKEQQFVVEELEDVEQPDVKPARKKHVTRMPREIIEKYAQSTENNQHICTKCVKVFSTRTNLIRHIQSHDGYKAYVCQICDKGFTQVRAVITVSNRCKKLLSYIFMIVWKLKAAHVHSLWRTSLQMSTLWSSIYAGQDFKVPSASSHGRETLHLHRMQQRISSA